MRIERWWWLGVFCIVSLCIHVTVGFKSGRLGLRPPDLRSTEIEVALEPWRPPKAEVKPEPKPKPKPEVKPKPEPKPKRVEKRAEPKFKPEPKLKPIVPKRVLVAKRTDPVPPAHEMKPEAAGLKQEKPVPLPKGRRDGLRVRMAKANLPPSLKTPDTEGSPGSSPEPSPEALPDSRLAGKAGSGLKVKPRDLGDGRRMTFGDPALSIGPSKQDELPRGDIKGPGGGAPKLTRLAKNLSYAGGGSPSPGPIPGGRDGFKGPEAPPDDLIFSNGGGAGGAHLPKARAKTGGGGGRSILSVDSKNPLAEPVHEERAGLGPGKGGGQGTGSGGGIGHAGGRGVGTDPNGIYALATLKSKPGPGIGAGSGRGTGSVPPGGRGTGADLPGTGGTGAGYGRGKGTGVGNGVGPGIASGGGGRGGSRLALGNPLADARARDEIPGLGKGHGMGRGTDPNAKRLSLNGLRGKPGTGLGGGGTGRGTGSGGIGGGRGTGLEQPGFGSGNGFGKGGRGIGSGGKGRGPGSGDGPGLGVGGSRLALNRGIPFGSISGLLGGDPEGGGGRGGGPGGKGRNVKPGGGSANDPVHIIYVLDTSTSMRQGNKIGRAKDALKRALAELTSKDSFNIVHFSSDVQGFSPFMVAASRDNLLRASEFVDEIQMQPGTNMSAGLELAFAQDKITHIFLLSDGEPTRGITNADNLRQAVKFWNRQKAQILTLALGLGEQFPGIPLLKGIAEDNEGKFSYINLAQ
jgi:VWA domain-containing protein